MKRCRGIFDCPSQAVGERKESKNEVQSATMTRGPHLLKRMFAICCSVAFCAVCASLFVDTGALGQEKTADSGWISLFNGKNLDGWRVKISGHDIDDNFAQTFRVEDGLLKVRYDGYQSFDGKFGHLYYKDSFSSYRLRVEYRFVGAQATGGPGWAFRNSGMMIHGQTPESIAKDQDFPVCIEVQLLGGGGSGKRTTGNLCTPGTNVVMDGGLVTRHCTNSQSDTYHGDQWVTAEVEVRGSHITHFIDGKPVLSYSEPQLDERDPDAKALLDAGHGKMLTRGTISVQSESHPIDFRKIELMKLED